MKRIKKYKHVEDIPFYQMGLSYSKLIKPDEAGKDWAASSKEIRTAK
jgi:hypothetical protein